MKVMIYSFLVVVFLGLRVHGANIDFDGPGGTPVDPTLEDGFLYSTLSGDLFRENGDGNPGADMEGSADAGHSGGVLNVARDAGGLFTFDQVDITQFGFGVTNINFEGFLGGSSQGVDTVATSAVNKDWRTVHSANLAGVPIDELRIQLDALVSQATEDIDNLVVTPIPEPLNFTMAALGALGLLCLASRRRSRIGQTA